MIGNFISFCFCCEQIMVLRCKLCEIITAFFFSWECNLFNFLFKLPFFCHFAIFRRLDTLILGGHFCHFVFSKLVYILS